MDTSPRARALAGTSLVILLLAGTSAVAQGEGPGPIDPNLAAALDQSLQGFAARYGVEGVAAAVIVPGGGTWVGADGNSTATEPIEPDMVFGIGSGTKTHTAALLLRLAEGGLVDLDTGVGTYLPWLAAYPNVPGTITLRQLLAQRSGLYNYTSHPNFGPTAYSDPEHLVSTGEILSLVGPPLSPPGAQWGYSNTNFYLAGLVIEAVTGMSAPEAFGSYLFEPFGLTHTRFGWEPVPEGQRWAHGWATLGGVNVDLTTMSPNSNFSAAFTAGALVSTAEEQARWAAALFGGQVLTPASFAQMTTLSTLSGSFPGGQTVGYGLGCFALRLGGQPVWAHNGRIRGYSGSLGYDPARGVSIAVLANRNGSANPDAMLAELHGVVAQHVVAAEGRPGATDGPAFDLVGPNPAGDRVTVRYTLPDASTARVEIMDALGRRVRVLDLGRVSAGAGVATLGTGELTPGVYLLRLTSGTETITRRVTVAR